jgi:uncharacterized repeat protein (TIGR01451 family)
MEDPVSSTGMDEPGRGRGRSTTVAEDEPASRSARGSRPGGRPGRSPAAARLVRLVPLLGLLALVVAPAVAEAADPFSITTPYPAIAVAPGSKASFDLSIPATTQERVDLSVSGIPQGWTADLRGGGYLVTSVLTDPKAAQSVRLDVTVPADAAAQTYRLTVVGVGGAARATLPLDVTVDKAAAGNVTMTTDFPSLKGPSSTTFTFNLTLTNDTAQDLTFGVNAQGPTGWTVTARPASQSQAATFQVNAGATAGITVTAVPPADVAAGAYPIQVTATSGDRNVGGQLQVEVTGQYSMSLTTPDGRLNASGQAGSVIARSLVVQNTGTAPLTQVTLSETLPSGWKVTYDPAGPIASIDPNQSATITANITPASNAIAGDYIATFRAHSDAASSDASTDIRVTVETSLTWLLVGVGIIVLALLGLGLVFQRFGRR